MRVEHFLCSRQIFSFLEAYTVRQKRYRPVGNAFDDLLPEPLWFGPQVAEVAASETEDRPVTDLFFQFGRREIQPVRDMDASGAALATQPQQSTDEEHVVAGVVVERVVQQSA
jgi:hypothetical protein